MKKLIVLLFVVALGATSFGMGGLGLKVGYDKPKDVDGVITFGVDYKFEVGAIELAPEFMYAGYTGNAFKTFNLNIVYPIILSGFTPYIGGQVGYTLTEGDNCIHYGAILGARIPVSPTMQPFAEFRYAWYNHSGDTLQHMTILAGLNILF